MYVQASEHFPGMELNLEKRTLRFSTEKFFAELEGVLESFDDPMLFDISETYSAVYHRFLGMDLSNRPAIRGQLEGPISFGFNVVDEEDRPILFNDTVRSFMFEFMAKRLNAQLNRLRRINSNAFMFIDEPGLQFLFSALSGYGDLKAKNDMDSFLDMVERPRGIHLCGNPDWDFLLNLDLEVLSLDVYTNAEIFSSYGSSIKKFLCQGGIIVWGIVPTGFEAFGREDIPSLIENLESIWKVLWSKGVDRQQMIAQSMISPATCCLINPDREKTVERAFSTVKQMAERLQEKYC